MFAIVYQTACPKTWAKSLYERVNLTELSERVVKPYEYVIDQIAVSKGKMPSLYTASQGMTLVTCTSQV